MLRAFLFLTLPLLSIVSPALAGPELGNDVAACRERPGDPKQNDPKPRLDACERVIASGQAAPKDLAFALGIRGNALLAKRDYDKAIAAFTDALKADPENVGIIDVRGIA
jgi:tetratricopeptide (TPR) repeat protein